MGTKTIKERAQKQIREVAKTLCQLASGCCVMALDPDRAKCTEKNCRIYPIARKALAEAKQITNG